MAFGGLALSRRDSFQQKLEKWLPFSQEEIPQFPEDKWLGRICVGEPGAHFDIKSEPDWNAPTVGNAWRDDVFEWKREVISKTFDINLLNQRWVETPEGYIYAEYVQKTRHDPQEFLTELPEQSTGERGMWVEIVTPLTDLDLTTSQENYQYWIRETIKPRIYYSQVFWACDVRMNPDTGKPQYCLKQLYGAWADTYWVDATICRRITPEEIAPIHPDAEDKHIVVNLAYQTLSCYEGDREVFFTKVTTGGYNWEEDKWRTPEGRHTTWRKLVSTHMSAGPAVGNYDVPGIAWTTLFDNNGAAIHSTYWHNYFGKPMSHGCVNTRPGDAKWVFRWTNPAVPYYPGLVEIQGMNLSTSVEVVAP